MRVAIVSDIHGNRRALEAVVADLRQIAPDVVVHGGDLAAGGAHPAEIIDQVRSLGWPGVRGNTDEMLWAPQRLAEYAATVAGPLGQCQRRRITEYLRVAAGSHRGLRTYSLSVHSPASRYDCREYGKRQPIL